MPDLPIPDHVHDPEPPDQGVSITILISGEQPVQYFLRLRALLGVEGIERIVQRSTLLVLTLYADVASPYDAEIGPAIGRCQQVPEVDHPWFGNGITRALSLVGLVVIDLRTERRRHERLERYRRARDRFAAELGCAA